jgi:hypothetical protein
MIAFSSDDFEHMARARIVAFKRIADALGENHAITKMMGGLAWGRYDCEPSPSNKGLRAGAEAKGFLDGYFASLNLWARDNDTKAQRVMLDLYPRGYSKFREGMTP